MKLFNEHKTAIILLSFILILSFLSSLKNDNLNEDSKDEKNETTKTAEKTENEKPVTKEPGYLKYADKLRKIQESRGYYRDDKNTQTKEKVEKPKKSTTTKTTTPVSGGGSDDNMGLGEIDGGGGSATRRDYDQDLSKPDLTGSATIGDEIKVTGVDSGTLVAKKTKRNYILKRSSVQLDIDWPKDSKKSKHLFYKVSVNNKYVTSLSDYSFNEKSFKANIGDVVRIDRKTKRSFNSYKFCTSFVILENKYQYLITCK